MIIYLESERYAVEAARLADLLQLPVLRRKEDIDLHEPVLWLSEEGVSLVQDQMKMRGDLSRMSGRIRPAELNRELLVKAAKPDRGNASRTAVDATAGLGEDAFLLAAAGFSVSLFEKDPVIALLLRDSLERAYRIPELKETAARMTVYESDSIEALRNNIREPDVILLDPMFPERQKSALVKKKFQLLHHLEKPCENERELLEAAVMAAPGRIIIKRPLKGPFLDGRKPSYSLRGKAIRYDVILRQDMGTI